MKVTIAIDSFKGSLSTYESAESVKEGILRVYPCAQVNVCPLADGGEGTVDAIIGSLGGEIRYVEVSDPLCRKIKAKYGIIENGSTAVMEMAEASGITLIKESERNPLYTTTYGFGEMIADAIENGCRRFIIGIGGSATNDGGTGMLSALGFEFTDECGAPISLGAIGLKALRKISSKNALTALKECEFLIACDVKNPLVGDQGCSRIYGGQKGADEEMIKNMDLWLKNFAELSKASNPLANEKTPGAGAAGGLGFAFLTYLGGKLSPGAELVINATNLEEKIKESDVVITGEGRLDGQSAMGKAPTAVAALAKKHGKPVIAIAGSLREDANLCNKSGIDAFFPIIPCPMTLSEAMDKANSKRNMANTAEQIFRLISSFSNN